MPAAISARFAAVASVAYVAAAEAGNRPIIRVAQTGYLDLGDGSGVQQLNYLDWMAWIIDQVQEAIY